ncbi:DUF3054 domain-containing protein [Micrococcales bacterium 31B]|nr:DUF3054 domain-containing protein [Micrococcales bacterium 31B]
MKKILAALGLDLLFVAAFVVIGTLSHDKAADGAALLQVAWPFYAGLGLAWLAVQAWRRPAHVWPTGVFVVAITIVAAMTLRLLTRAGVELSFVLVTTAFLSLCLLGWRWIASAQEARRRMSAADQAIIDAAREAGAHVDPTTGPSGNSR